MAYHLENTQLRVLHKYVQQASNITALKNSRLLILEHILSTTEEFVRHLLKAGAEIFAVVAKPYSIDEEVLKRLKKLKLKIVLASYKEMEESTILDELLAAAVEKSKEDKKQIVIVEVGGYFAAPLTRISLVAPQFIAGVVEDTTFGHNRYVKLLDKIRVPVFSVARSALKEIEARFVGRDAVAAVEKVLRELGVSIAGRKALVIGYGMIGSNVARALRRHDLSVYVYDKHDFKDLRARIDGFQIHQKKKLLEIADIIFAATADVALNGEEIFQCNDNAILVSVGSKNTEFDIATLTEQAIKKTPLGQHVVKYSLTNSRNIMVVKEGTAVNFLLPSLPIEVLDLVFSEVFVCMMQLLKKSNALKVGKCLYTAGDEDLNKISKEWLTHINI